MSKRIALSTAILLFAITPVFAQQTMTFDWEDGTSTALGIYGGANLANTDEAAHSGTRSLKFWEDPISGTPQAFIWWVTGCTDGDVIDASFYMWDDTPGASPSGRIWAHYTDTDVNSYAGSASGNSAYTSGIGWEQMAYQWTFDSDMGARDGIVIEARIYSGSAGSEDSLLYVDYGWIQTTNTTTAVIHNARGDVPVELAAFSATAIHGAVDLTWSTASELDNLGFNIFRAMDASERTMINAAIVPGAGTTMETMFYGYMDRNVTAGASYRYWLEQVDYQGTTEMFGPVSVAIPATMPEAVLLAASPLPVEDATAIKLSLPGEAAVTLSAYDLQGREVARIYNGDVVGGTHSYAWDRGDVAAGTYMLRAATSLGDATLRVILR